MTPQPITYTTKSRIVGLNVNSPGRLGWNPNPLIEVELRSDIGQPISFHGTLGLTDVPADLPVYDADAILNGQVEVTVRWLVKQTRVVPWKAEEVPLGAWFRRKSDGLGRAQALISVASTCVHIAYGTMAGGNTAHNDCVAFDSLAETWEVTTDGGKTWKPAGWVEEVYD